MSDSWIGSLDVDSYVKQLIAREQNQIDQVTQMKNSQLISQQSDYKVQVSSYGQVQNLLNTLQQNINSLMTAFNATYSVSSSDENIATVQADGSLTPGNHTLTVHNLAQAEQIASRVFTNNSNALGMTNTLTVGVGANSFNFNITSTDTLQTIAQKINTGASANNLGVTASVVSTGTNQYRLIVSSTNTGVDNAVNLTETGTGSNALDISTGNDGTGTVLSEAKNAYFTLDNLDYNLADNSNLVSGMDITLTGVGSATLSVNQTSQLTKINSAAQTMVDTYNQLMTFIAQTKANSALPDSSLTLIQNSLKDMMSNVPDLTSIGIVPMPYKKIPDLTVTPPSKANLATASITTKAIGLIMINTDPNNGPTFSQALADNYDNVKAKLFGQNNALTKVTAALATSTGSVWQVLNDPSRGSIPRANLQISNLQSKINTNAQAGADLKSGLLIKYGKLDMLLGNLQVTSQYLSQQLAVLGK